MKEKSADMKRRTVDTVEILFDYLMGTLPCFLLPGLPKDTPFGDSDYYTEERVIWAIITEWAELKGYANPKTN